MLNLVKTLNQNNDLHLRKKTDQSIVISPKSFFVPRPDLIVR